MCLNLTPATVLVIAVLVPSLWQLGRQLTALRWRSTAGIIRGHRIRRRFGPNDETFYEVVPEYSYQVENVGLVGDRLSFSDKSAAMTQSQALEAAGARYPEGGAVIVYYDPRHPERSVLERDINYVIPLIAVLAAGLFAQAGHVFACRT